MDHGHREKISGLYLEMYPMLFEYALSSLSNNALAEEAVQDTFAIACQKVEALLGSPNPKGWLVNTLKHVIANTRRRQTTAARILADYLEANLEEYLTTNDSLGVDLLYGDLAGTEEFQLLKEVALDGKSYLEMAQTRNIRVDACRKRVQRAKKLLRIKVKP